MKIRPLPIFLSFFITACLLFGGWFVYGEQFVKKPIRDEVEKLNGVSLHEIKVGRQQVTMMISLQDPKKFQSNYQQIKRIAKEKAGNKKVVIDFKSAENEMQTIWEDIQLQIAEAIDLHQYSRIQQVFESLKGKKVITDYVLRIDEEAIYIYMTNGDSPFYKVLTRTKEVN
jgi:hypothetical protein